MQIISISYRSSDGKKKTHVSPHSSFGVSYHSDYETSQKQSPYYPSRGATSTVLNSNNEAAPNKLHMLSIGTQHLVFSLWLDPIKDNMHICISREVEGESSILSQSVVTRVGLIDGEWHHVGLCVPTINVRRGGQLKMTLFIDGMSLHNVVLQVAPVGSIKKSSPSYLMLGHTNYSSLHGQVVGTCTGEDEVQYGTGHFCRRGTNSSGAMCSATHKYKLHMANTYLFREPLLTRELCLYLMALGKDAASLLPLSKKDERVLMCPLITPKLLSASIDLSVLYANMSQHIRPLQESLLLLHQAQHPQQFLCYKPHIPSLQDSGNQYPVCTAQSAIVFGELCSINNRSPDMALLQLGGISHLVYLFARIVEVSGSEREQAWGLTLLLQAVESCPQLAAQYTAMRGSQLVFRILRSPLATPGVQVIKALLDGCVSPSVVQYLACRDVYTVAAHIPAMLVNRDLMDALITNWKTFMDDTSAHLNTKYCVDENGCRLSVLGVMLSCIKVLLSDKQPFRDFNLAQLRDIDALDKILFMCKELEVTGISLKGILPSSLVVAVFTGLIGGHTQNKMDTHNAAMSPTSLHDSYSSSGFHSGPLTSGGGVALTGSSSSSSSRGLGSLGVRVRDVAAVYAYLLLAHPAHLTYAATDHHTAYYLTHLPATQQNYSRRGNIIAVGVDAAAEMTDDSTEKRIPQRGVPTAGDWIVIGGNNAIEKQKLGRNGEKNMKIKDSENDIENKNDYLKELENKNNIEKEEEEPKTVGENIRQSQIEMHPHSPDIENTVNGISHHSLDIMNKKDEGISSCVGVDNGHVNRSLSSITPTEITDGLPADIGSDSCNEQFIRENQVETKLMGLTADYDFVGQMASWAEDPVDNMESVEADSGEGSRHESEDTTKDVAHSPVTK
ncbi:unnamed protein product, partial [Meganyctiphanes norvegica]